MSRSGVDPVTARWVQALWNLAQAAGVVEKVERDLAALADALAAPAIRTAILKASTPRSQRRALVLSAVQGAQSLTQRFVQLALDRGRSEVLFGAGAAFRARTLDQAGIVEGVVEAARPLDAAVLERLQAGLGRRLGKTVRLRQRNNPALVGGARVTVGSHMIDASVSGRIEGLRRRLLDAPLPVPAAL